MQPKSIYRDIAKIKPGVFSSNSKTQNQRVASFLLAVLEIENDVGCAKPSIEKLIDLTQFLKTQI